METALQVGASVAIQANQQNQSQFGDDPERLKPGLSVHLLPRTKVWRTGRLNTAQAAFSSLSLATFSVASGSSVPFSTAAINRLAAPLMVSSESRS